MTWKWSAIRKGELYWEPVMGGSHQREAPFDGILIEGVGILPADELRGVLAGMLFSNGYDDGAVP